MGNKVLVLGDSGSGKSTSTKNLDPKSTFYINVIGKALPFKGWKWKYKSVDNDTKEGNYIVTHDSSKISNYIKWVSANRPEIKVIIVDDAQYVMSFEFMERASEKGYDKFIEIAKHMFDVLAAPDGTREDLTTIYLTHSEDVSANGFIKTKMKTIGKMLDEKICIEGLFTIVLLCYLKKSKEKEEYVFVTQSNGSNTVKSPMGMFPLDSEGKPTIPNDLVGVLEGIKKYEEE